MTRIIVSITQTIIFSLCMMSANAIAETDFSSIEEEERAQIISELTFHLDTNQSCTQTLNWDDSGSGADLDGYFFIPTLANNDYMIGGHASGKRTSKYHCVTTVSEPASKPNGAPALLVAPADWKQVWKDSGSGATKDGSFWVAIPPDNNYKCLGSVSQLGHNAKPKLPKYRCVHTSLTDKIATSAIIWSDKGTGADKKVTIFSLPNTGSFTAVGSSASKIETYDLKKNAASVPDPKMVEEILAKRLGPIKADIEAKTVALKEQKAAAKKEESLKEEANKEAAKKAEQKKLAEAAAKKKQAIAAEQKALAEKVPVETEDSAEAAQSLKDEQQERIAEAAAKKDAAAAAEKKKIAMQEKAAEAKIEQVKEAKQAEPEPMAEPMVEKEPAEIMETSSASASEPKKESKGLNDILMFFVKIFAIMVGGVIVFIVAFKVLFGKKKEK